MKNKLLGGLYGALIGDACGVPYEFNPPGNLPAKSKIDMVPPDGFRRTWGSIPVGTYSDDGAQILCLLEVLTSENRVTDSTIRQILQDWMYDGHLSVDSNTFDVGNQTSAALRRGSDVSKLNEDRFNGNGSLMRTLPVALVATSATSAYHAAFAQSGVTHPHIRSRLCCALYAVIAWHMLNGSDLSSAVDQAFDLATTECTDETSARELALISSYRNDPHTGTGYVVDSLWSAIDVVQKTTTYDAAIREAISLGNDTDTTACIAGGLAGILYGYDNILEDWLTRLRGRNIIDPLAARLVKHRERSAGCFYCPSIPEDMLTPVFASDK